MAGVDGQVEEAVAHFFPALFAPDDFGFGVGVPLVVGGVVPGGGELHLHAAGEFDGFGEVVGELPVEVIIGDFQQSLFLVAVD